jgi:hypothetical protein
MGMAKAKLSVTAGDMVRQFSHYSDLSLAQPVVVTKNGRPRNVLISYDEFERLSRRDQQAFKTADTPDRFLAGIEALAKDNP